MTNHPDRDELAKLVKYDVTVLSWFWLFHHWLPWSEAAQSQPLCLTQQAIPMG
ncbi:MAG: hypothetical protein ACI9A1_000330 [Lentimonas sp.]